MALGCAISIHSRKVLHSSLICTLQNNTTPRKQAFLMLSWVEQERGLKFKYENE